MDFNKKELLFKYEFSDAWHMTIFELVILNKKENNIFMSTELTSKPIELPFLLEEDIEKIKEIVCNEKIYEINQDEVEMPMVMDGYNNTFTFNNGEQLKEIDVCNMRYLEIKDTKNAKIIKECFDKISKIVYKRTYVKMPL